MITQKILQARKNDFLCWTCASKFLTKDEIRHLTKVTKQGECGLCGTETSVGQNEFWSYEAPVPPPPPEQILIRLSADGKKAEELQIYHCGECGWVGLEHERQVIPMLDKAEAGQIVHVCRVCKFPDFWLEKDVLRKFEIVGDTESVDRSMRITGEIISEGKIKILKNEG